MSAEAGWYYAEGDPPNTLRRWNGEQWIGFPIEDPASGAARTHVVGVKPFQPIPGQVSLEHLAVAAKVALLLCIPAHGYLAWTVWQNSQYDAVEALDTLEVAPTPILTAVTILSVVVVLAAIAFIAWFATAYRNLSRWHTTRREPGWASVVFFTPLVQFRWPWDMMLEMVEKSARPEQQGQISPFIVLGWWVPWTFHQTLFGASMGLSRYTDFGATSYQIAMAGSLVAIVGLGFGIVVVDRITAAQESRRRPTKAQRELATQNALV